MITHNMKRVLVEELRYSKREVSGMDPERARSIIDNRISSRGPPSSYNIASQESAVTPQNTILEEMDGQFADVTERVLNDDQYGRNVFSNANDGCIGTWEETNDGCTLR